jgi:Nitrogen regulatory protein PII
MMSATKKALDALGYPSVTAVAVLGRGKQRGIADEVDIELRPLNPSAKSGGMKYIPKRQITLVIPDRDVDNVVRAIIEVNRTGEIGDGKIFVCPVDGALRIRTGQRGEEAIL